MQLRSIIPTVAVTAAFLAPAPGLAAPAPRTFDLVTYAPPTGFTVQEAGDHVALTRVGSKSYCIIGIYAGTDAAGDLDASFAAEWKDVALHAVDPVAAPAITHATIGGAPADVGIATSTTQGKPVLAVLTTIDAGAKVVSILVLTPGADDLKVYTPSIQSLLASLAIRRVEPANTAAPTPPAPSNDGGAPGDIPAPARPLTVADLAGEWKHGGNSIKSYVDASTGNYAGYGAVVADETWTITAKGVLTDDYNGINSGNFGSHQVSSKTTSKIVVKPDGELIITPKAGEGAEKIYIIRGWRVTPELTLLRIVGPWYDEHPPTADEIHNPNVAGNLQSIWVRKTPRK